MLKNRNCFGEQTENPQRLQDWVKERMENLKCKCGSHKKQGYEFEGVKLTGIKESWKEWEFRKNKTGTRNSS